jgi:hypothetical protein
VWWLRPLLICEVPWLCVLLGLAPGKGPAYVDATANDIIVVVAIAKNEGEYVVEWVDHHLSLGVSCIFLFDDTGPKDAHPIRPKLAHYIASGRVRVFDITWADGRRFLFGVRTLGANTSVIGVRDAYGPGALFWMDKQDMINIEAWKRLVQEGAPRGTHVWLSLLDLDEFINPHGADLRALLRAARLKGARGVHAAREVFGNGGHITRPRCHNRSGNSTSCVRESYLWRTSAPDIRFKGIALLRGITGALPTCVHSHMTHAYLADVVSRRAFNKTLQCNFFGPRDWEGHVVRDTLYARPEELSIAHYEIKSMQECKLREARKQVAGDVKRRNCGYKGDYCDASMLRYVSPNSTHSSALRLAITSCHKQQPNYSNTISAAARLKQSAGHGNERDVQHKRTQMQQTGASSPNRVAATRNLTRIVAHARSTAVIRSRVTT